MPFVSTEGAIAIVTPIAERQWTFKSTVDDYQVLERARRLSSPRRGIKKIALLADTSGFGQGAAAQLKKVGPRRDLDVMYESFEPADTDMMPQLTRIRDAGARRSSAGR